MSTDRGALDGAMPEAARKVSLWRIFRRTKTACLATFSYGAFQASVVLFLPIFLERERGVAEKNTIFITAFFALGMLLFSNYASRLGDRHGHLRLMTLFSFIGFLMVATFPFLRHFALMCASVFVAGATLASLSPLSLALQGLVVEETELGKANALYNAFYAVGMLLGPVVSSLMFEHFQGTAMLGTLATLWGSYVLFALFNAGDDPRARASSPIPTMESLVPTAALSPMTMPTSASTQRRHSASE